MTNDILVAYELCKEETLIRGVSSTLDILALFIAHVKSLLIQFP